MKKVILGAMALSLVVFTSCNNDDDDNGTVNEGTLSLNVTGLEDLGDDYAYEGWIIVDGSPVTTGVFTVDSDGTLSKTSFTVNEEELEAATAFVLSIEPAVDTDPAPADTKLLIGEFSDDTAMVSSTGIVADFSAAAGSYILATPTDMDDTNELSGIWFLDNTDAPTLTAGLTLPELSAGWVYEGWVVLDGTPVSTGTFTDATIADDNASTSEFKGDSNDGPAFPGEDFVMGAAAGIDFPTDLTGATVVISVEPSPDNSDAPFALKPLAGMVPTGIMTGDLEALGEGPLTTISGTVTR